MKDKAVLLLEKDKKCIVDCLCNAIGDDLKESLRVSRISDRYSNSKKFLKWDIINRNFVDNFVGKDIVADYANRGAWHMVPLVDKANGCIYSVMREERFRELQKKQTKRRKAHYIDAFTQSFNFDLNQGRQISFFGNDCFDNEEVSNIVDSIMKSINVDKGIITRHALVLFEEYHSEIVSVRCCILDSSLNIVESEEWSQFIIHNESVIVDNSDELEVGEMLNKPIGLKKKAKDRAGRKENVQTKKRTEINENKTV
ncbi:MAG: hypothetical protein H2184_18680 [Candidatus Galacturonibacter soehngenii]|nr:hypothetical protein [Candidatus Galacturonibacter soehngenii]